MSTEHRKRTNLHQLGVLEAEAAVIDGEDIHVAQLHCLFDLLLVDKGGVDLGRVLDPGLVEDKENEDKRSTNCLRSERALPVLSTLISAWRCDTCGSWMRISQSEWLQKS